PPSATIPTTGTGINGQKCSVSPSPCVSFATVSCTGTACSAVPFNRILTHMRGFNSNIAAANVTISYTDVGIGFAGGPRVPMVTVTVSGVQYNTGLLGLLLTTAADKTLLNNVVKFMPARSASMTGEDLSL